MTPSSIVSKILLVVMTGGETSDDFAKLLAMDTELQHWVRLTVQRLGFEKHANKLIQAVALLGQNRIRDLILGRNMERSFCKPEETILGKLMLERDKAKAEGDEKGAEKKKEKTAAAPAADGEKEKEPEAPAEEAELVPPIAEFSKYLAFATRSEDVAISIRNSYPGQAFAGGVVYDLVYHHMKTQNFEVLTDDRLKKTDAFLEEIFRDGLRCGIAANEIMQKISIPHQKNVFVSALVHNIGKALLLIYDPKAFEEAWSKSSGAPKDSKIPRMTSDDAEEELFGFDHAQAGSLFMGRLPFLAEIERSIDYHHNPHLLKFSNPKLYALACVLRVSGALVKLYQRIRADNPNIDEIRDQKLCASEDFAFLRLTPEDWADVKSNYALKLMKVGY